MTSMRKRRAQCQHTDGAIIADACPSNVDPKRCLRRQFVLLNHVGSSP